MRLQENKQLLLVKQRFDEQHAVIRATDLKPDSVVADRSKYGSEAKDPLFYNNFGICAQALVSAQKEGLARVRASFTVYEKLNGPSRVLDSPFAEIAVYQPLKTFGKKYKPFLADLYSTKQISQEFSSFEQFYNTEEEYHLNFGTHVVWFVSGGTNFWQDYTERYQYRWTAVMKDRETESADSVVIASKHFES